MPMGVKTAVILAAGRGTRLGKRGLEAPKGFLQIGEKPIIQESLDRLKAAGVEKVVIVTGHLAHFYEKLAADSGGFVRTVHNPDYADSGSMYSLYQARKALGNEAFFLLESDLIYESRALAALKEQSESDCILMSGFTGSGDEVWIYAPEGYLVDMGKVRKRLPGPPCGELVGVSLLSPEGYSRLCIEAERLFSESLKVEYETALVASSRKKPIACHLVSDLVWSEIDDESHLQRAKTRIYPRLS
jgi:2-aminoethylphosphonate-pyruvate transaminase